MEKIEISRFRRAFVVRERSRGDARVEGETYESHAGEDALGGVVGVDHADEARGELCGRGSERVSVSRETLEETRRKFRRIANDFMT